MLDQRLPSGSRVPYSLNGERWLSKALDGPIDGRARESGNTGDEGNTSSSQLLGIDGSDKVLLSLIQVRKQQAVFLLKFFCCAHTDSITQCASFVTIINLRALSPRLGVVELGDQAGAMRHPVAGGHLELVASPLRGDESLRIRPVIDTEVTQPLRAIQLQPPPSSWVPIAR